jgi:transposase
MHKVRQSSPQASRAQGSLSRAEIAERSESASTASERRRWLVIGMLADGAMLAEIEAATAYRPRTIREIVQRYRELGPAALADRRAHSQGAAPLLTVEQQRELQQALQRPPPDDDVWTGPAVARWIAAKTGRHVHRQRGWDYLRRLKGSDTPAQPRDESDRPA